jgi:hypothetical protein
MLAGTICSIGSMVLTSFCKAYYQYILCQGVLFGLGVGLLYVIFIHLWYIVEDTDAKRRFYPSLASISTHFSKYRATALGVGVAGSSLGRSRFRTVTVDRSLTAYFSRCHRSSCLRWSCVSGDDSRPPRTRRFRLGSAHHWSNQWRRLRRGDADGVQPLCAAQAWTVL